MTEKLQPQVETESNSLKCNVHEEVVYEYSENVDNKCEIEMCVVSTFI
jgi:hypothetical protein